MSVLIEDMKMPTDCLNCMFKDIGNGYGLTQCDLVAGWVKMKDGCRADECPLAETQPEPNWTPVSERLPEEIINPNTQDYDWVLCSTTFGDVRAYHFGMGRFLHGCGDVTQYVTAWMPLPEPYREEGD